MELQIESLEGGIYLATQLKVKRKCYYGAVITIRLSSQAYAKQRSILKVSNTKVLASFISVLTMRCVARTSYLESL